MKSGFEKARDSISGAFNDAMARFK